MSWHSKEGTAEGMNEGGVLGMSDGKSERNSVGFALGAVVLDSGGKEKDGLVNVVGIIDGCSKGEMVGIS
jgi:hypothetical protein